MFGKLFSKEVRYSSKSGFFKVDGQLLFPIDESPVEGTMNSWIESIGYKLGQIHVVLTNSDEIRFLGFKAINA